MKLKHKSVFVLVVMTLIVVQLYHAYGDAKTKVILPTQYSFLATNDQVSKGNSTSELYQRSGKAVMDCDLKHSDDYPWPYCGVSIHINPNPEVGLDLSQYHTVRLDIDFKALDDGDDPRMRFYLRNYNPEYSTPDNEYTHKYNGIEYLPQDGKGTVEIPLASLQVMTWWLADNDIGIKHSAPEFSNINKIEFATGSATEVGRYQMSINRIEFIGDYIKGEDLFMGLLFVWVTIGSLLTFGEIRRNRRMIHQANLRQAHLKNINRSLRAQNFEFAELASRDALTGAMNRHAAREWIKSYGTISVPSHRQLSVLYLDIDYFKNINDKFGHALGDDILREFVMVILSVVRKQDRLVRWGGEEFIVFCPDTGLEEAAKLAERIRTYVENHIWVHGEVLTCSIGVAELGSGKATEAIARADEALYIAKHNGRNQVHISE